MIIYKKIFAALSFLLTLFINTGYTQHALVLQSDFGTQDAAVASMKGVAVSVAPDLQIFDITHEIPPYNIWEAAYRLVRQNLQLRAGRYAPALH